MTDTKPMRDTSGEKKTAWVTEGLINAIKTMEANQKRERPQSELAQAAYAKLQFDFPDVQLEELKGLVAELRSSLTAKAGVCPFSLTSKLVENITEGACYAQPLTSSSSTANAISSSDNAQHTAAPGQNGHLPAMDGKGRPDPTREKPLSVAASLQFHRTAGGSTASRLVYQDLCSAVLLDWMTKLLSLPEEAAWQLLGSFHTKDTSPSGLGKGTEADSQNPATPVNSVLGKGVVPGEGGSLEEEVDGIMPASAHTGREDGKESGKNDTSVAVSESTLATIMYEEVIAAEQDDDDMAYEDMSAAPAQSASPPSHGIGPSQSISPAWTASADREHHHISRGNNIADASTSGRGSFTQQWGGFIPGQRISYSSGSPLPHVSHQSHPYSWPIFKDRLLALASHTRYSVLCERVLWSPGSHLPESVMVLLRTLGAHSRSSELQELMGVYVQLLTERLLDVPSDMKLLGGLGEALAIGANGGSTAGSQPARCPPDQPILSPELVMLLTMFSQLAARLTNPSHISLFWHQIDAHFLPSVELGFRRVERAGESHPEVPNSLSLLSSVMEFYVAAAPRGVRESGLGLGERGMLRVLSALFARYASQPGAEPLRRCVLVCAASSAPTLKWLAAVPSVQRVLQSSCYEAAGTSEAHGVVWELLLKGGESKQAGVVLNLLDTPSEVLRPLRLLELLCKCQAVQPYGQRLCGTQLQAAMQQVFNRLQKDLSTMHNPASDGGSSLSGMSVEPVSSTSKAVSALSAPREPHSGLHATTHAESAGGNVSGAESAGGNVSGAESAGGNVSGAESADRDVLHAESAGRDGTGVESAGREGTGAESSATGRMCLGEEEKSLQGGTPDEMREKMQQRVLPACWRLLKELLLQVDVVKKD